MMSGGVGGFVVYDGDEDSGVYVFIENMTVMDIGKAGECARPLPAAG